jgi:hypothetical protein
MKGQRGVKFYATKTVKDCTSIYFSKTGWVLTYTGQIELTNSSSSSFCIHQSTVLKESLDSQTLMAMGNSDVQTGAQLKEAKLARSGPVKKYSGASSIKC